jgi:hypothetical protein
MPLLYATLDRVLAECAETASCAEFIERDGEWFAVVTQQDILDYCESRNVGRFPGKRQCLMAFVRSSDGAVVSWEPKRVYWHRGGTEYDAMVARFLAGSNSLRTLGGAA